MIPSAVAALLPAPIGEIVATAGKAIALKEAMQIARGTGSLDPRGVYSRFVGAMTKAGASVAEARESYAPAKYWIDQGAILSKTPEDEPLDPRTAREIAGGRYAAEYGTGYRYGITVTYTPVGGGDSFQRNVWVNDPELFTPSVLFAEAAVVAEDILGYMAKADPSLSISNFSLSYEINDFARVV